MKDKLQELMTITMEECGELIQECSKAIRCDNYYDNTKLLQEVSDVYCMLELMLIRMVLEMVQLALNMGGVIVLNHKIGI